MSSPPIDLLRPLLYDGPWRVHPGDDLAWADPTLDRSDWPVLEATRFRVRWDEQPPLAGATAAWFEAPLHVRFRDGQQPAIAVHAVGGWEAYIDGQRIGGDGTIGESPAPWHGPRVLSVPQALVQDETLDVAIRVWMPKSYDQLGGALFTVRLGDRATLETEATSWLQRTRLADAPYPFVGTLLFFAGLVHLYVWARRRELRAYGVFGAAAAIYGLTMAWNFLAYDGFVPVTWGMGFVQALGFSLGGVLFVLFASVFSGTNRTPVRVLLALVLPNALLGQLVGGRLATVAAYATLFLPAVGYALWSVAVGIHKRVPGGRSMGAGLAAFALLWLGEDIHYRGHTTTEATEPLHIFLISLSVLALTGGAIAALGARFAAGLDDLEAALAAARRFVPVAFLRRVGRDDIREVQRGDAVEREMTVLFLDVRSFTTLAENRPASQMFGFVNELWAAIEPAIVEHGGFVNRFTGDGMLALFDDPQGAVRATVGVSRALDSFDAERLLGVPITVGLGIHTGPMLLGTVGGREHLAAGVVADAANLGARIEGMTKVYGSRVLLSGDTVRRLSRAEDFVLRELDRVVAVGRAEPVDLYELVDAEREPDRAARRASAASYALGLASYRAGRIAEAVAAFDACVDDPAGRAMATRCRTLGPLPVGWTGVWQMAAK